ncbi:MAG: Fic family protein [Spirobacillus cienkowskii]|jgi:Fic family protein|uniref:Fic family protein n=1 Tax=Spirobacillus cienkowskii TaxID=495820 RepID=A0A369KTR9_9BACT|nr:MAG: Fic family protein [Spirobacillus cienkowskii]
MNAFVATPDRSGKYIRQINGYNAFRPNPLPPHPPIVLDEESIVLLAEAHQSLGRLDGLAGIIPDPDIFIYAFVRKEALLSSQIEGTQCSLEDVLSDEPPEKDRVDDVEEVSNYVASMKLGLERLVEIPISSRLIKEIHARLMNGVRGANKIPGEYRTTQNWLGRLGATLETADFIPPPPHEVENCMGELEKFIHYEKNLPLLVKAALIHSQFETIHPFLDGNGRVGRLLITLLLCDWNLLKKPLLYLSYFLKANRTEYYNRLNRIRTHGDYENWIKFFLRGIIETSESAVITAQNIVKLHSSDRMKINDSKPSPIMNQIFDKICRMPIQSVPSLSKSLNTTIPTIQRSINKMVKLGIIKEITGQARYRRFAYVKYLKLLVEGTSQKPG